MNIYYYEKIGTCVIPMPNIHSFQNLLIQHVFNINNKKVMGISVVCFAVQKVHVLHFQYYLEKKAAHLHGRTNSLL